MHLLNNIISVELISHGMSDMYCNMVCDMSEVKFKELHDMYFIVDMAWEMIVLKI